MQFSAPWPHLSVISVIDILLVAIVIYEFLALIKGTRASLMVVGVAGLGLAFYLSRLGNLAALNWLISTLLPYRVRADCGLRGRNTASPGAARTGTHAEPCGGFGGGCL